MEYLLAAFLEQKYAKDSKNTHTLRHRYDWVCVCVCVYQITITQEKEKAEWKTYEIHLNCFQYYYIYHKLIYIFIFARIYLFAWDLLTFACCFLRVFPFLPWKYKTFSLACWQIAAGPYRIYMYKTRQDRRLIKYNHLFLSAVVVSLLKLRIELQCQWKQS